MSMDLNTKDGRKNFITENITNILTAINDSYGPILLEQLLKRIEFTINEFNSEINEAFKQLQKKDKHRQKIYDKIHSTDKENINNRDSNKSEWEEKLEEIESTKK